MVGKNISHFRILKKLCEGGVGVVDNAHDTKLDRYVALKFLSSHLTTSETDKSRFLQDQNQLSQSTIQCLCDL